MNQINLGTPTFLQIVKIQLKKINTLVLLMIMMGIRLLDNDAGFGLIHLLVALVVVSVLTIGGMQLLQVSDDQQNRAEVRQILQSAGSASQAYWKDHTDGGSDASAWPNNTSNLINEGYLNANPFTGSNMSLNVNYNVQGDNSLTISVSGTSKGTSISQQQNFDEPVDPRTATTYSGNLEVEASDTEVVTRNASDWMNGNGYTNTITLVNMNNYPDMDVLGVSWSIGLNVPFNIGNQFGSLKIDDQSRHTLFSVSNNRRCNIDRFHWMRIENMQTENGNVRLRIRYWYEDGSYDRYGDCIDDSGSTWGSYNLTFTTTLIEENPSAK